MFKPETGEAESIYVPLGKCTWSVNAAADYPLSRPVTYLTWEAQAEDGKEHQVEVHFEASPEIAANDTRQEIRTTIPEIAGLAVLGFGSVDQPVLKMKGDDLRADWGWFYVAGAGTERLRNPPAGLVAVR